ncbi:asparagine synthase C-terminal domain-containing protein [Nitratifractor sp.]|uniref:asparagine synthase-related protein n=1 Tax=Nitratifractor sp. TaxID=2268144 RepID=UPI0025F8E5F7|nr:asparagine synthase C-terminal domain-containing protein [Nitratifractor sp.]
MQQKYYLEGGKASHKLSSLIDDVSSVKLNYSVLKDFLWFSTLDPEMTFYEGVYRLPYGYELNTNGNPVEVWNPFDIDVDYSMSYQEVIDGVRFYIEKSLKKLLNQDILACELSGGYDSSTVYMLARKLGSDPHVLTLAFKDSNADERRYADAVLRKWPSDKVHRIDADKIDYADRYNMRWNYKLNPHWPIWITFSMLGPFFDIAKANGIRRILTGQMGDHLFLGTKDGLWSWLHMGHPLRFAKELSYLPHPLRFCLSGAKKRLKSYLKPTIEDSKALFVSTLRYSTLLEKEMIPKPTFAELHTDHTFCCADKKQMLLWLTNSSFHMSRYSSFGRALYEQEGIEHVSPFEDRELIEFMLSIPPQYRYGKGNPRYLHAQVMKDLLPTELQQRRKKAEFSISVWQQMATIDHDRLWEKPVLVEMELLQKETIRRFQQAYKAKKFSNREFQMYWRMINIEYWYALNPYLDKSEFPPNPYVLEST